jgi:K+-transporting ATPase ATPase C chain
MKHLISELRAAVAATVALLVVCCGLYPLAVYAVGQLAFPRQANGSLIVEADGRVRGSELIGQRFTQPKYFHPRPSAAGANGYDAASSSGSNLGPTSQTLHTSLKDRIAAYRAENQLGPEVAIPADAVTASASGLDPHISPRNAALQLSRVASARGWSHQRVQSLIDEFTDHPALPRFIGQPGVNVLLLNRALDTASNYP